MLRKIGCIPVISSDLHEIKSASKLILLGVGAFYAAVNELEKQEIKDIHDKRMAHLTSLIVSGQMVRDEALAELNKPLYGEAELRDDREFVIKKLGITEKEFEEIENEKPRSYKTYPSMRKVMYLLAKILGILKKI